MEERKPMPTPIAKESPFSKLAELPSFDSYDISLGMSHNNALELAEQVLSEISKNERVNAFKKLYLLFEEWKEKYGIYPAPSPLLKIFLDNTTESEKKGKDLAGRLPWECDPYARTPFRLFIKLRAENYPPLDDYISKVRYDCIYATLIIMTHRQGQPYQSGDCIKCAMELFRLRMILDKSMIENLLPLAKQELNRKRGLKLRNQAQKEERKQSVRREYIELCSQKNGPPKNLQQAIAKKVGIKQPQVSKILKELELESKNLDSFIDGLNRNIPCSSRNK